jgi:hypothetical protein
MEIKYDSIRGAIVDTQNEKKVSQPELLAWTLTHPETITIDEPKLTKIKPTVMVSAREIIEG